MTLRGAWGIAEVQHLAGYQGFCYLIQNKLSENRGERTESAEI